MNHFKAYSMLFAILLAAASGAQAQSGAMKGMEMKDGSTHDMKNRQSAKQGPTHRAAGIVQNTDPAKGTVTIAHGAVKSLNWPAMTMSFAVQEKSLLDKIKPGAKVAFGLVQSGQEFVITEIKAQ